MDSYHDNTPLKRAVRSMITTSSLFWIEPDGDGAGAGDFHGNHILKYIASDVLREVPDFHLVSTIANRMMDEMEKEPHLSSDLISRIAGFRAYLANNVAYQFGTRLIEPKDVLDVTDGVQITMHEPDDIENSSIMDFYSVVREDRNVFRFEPLINRRIFEKHGVAAVLASNYFAEDLKDNESLIQSMIETDNITYIPCEEKYIPVINKRVRYLKEHHADLWNFFVERLYFDFYNHVYDVAMRADMNVNLLKECLNVFPNDYVISRIDFNNYNVHPKCGSLAILRLTQLNDDAFIFHLGLPRDTCVYTDAIRKRIAYDVIRDPYAHLAKVRELTKSRLMSTIADAEFVHGKCYLINENDTLFEDIEGYGPNEVIRYVDENGKIFQFTPREFSGIIKSQKNPYTNGLVYVPALYKMRGRLELEVGDTVENMMFKIIAPRDWDEMVHETEDVRAVNYMFMKLMTAETWKEHIVSELDDLNIQLNLTSPGPTFRPAIFSEQAVSRYNFTPEIRNMLLGRKPNAGIEAGNSLKPLPPGIEEAKAIYVKNTVDFIRNIARVFSGTMDESIYKLAESSIQPVIDTQLSMFMDKMAEMGIRVPDVKECGHNVNTQKK